MQVLLHLVFLLRTLRLIKVKELHQVHTADEVSQLGFKYTVFFLVHRQQLLLVFPYRVTDVAIPVAVLGSIRPERAAHKIKQTAP